MTLVYERPGDGPRVHVLAIGVGGYRHLPGGSEEVPHNTLGLRQLSGPPASAKAFTRWIVANLRHPRAELGTVELLLSPEEAWAPDGEPAVPVERPSMANVLAAFERWYRRCDEDSGNVALFYFCGHGVERESPFLLLEDFGRSEMSLLENAVDIGETYAGMARCAAGAQYFLVDACREIPFELTQLLNGNARVLVDPRLVGDDRQETALLFATSGGAKAYGRAGRPTRFTEAVLSALGGLGGRYDGRRWVVDYLGLQRAATILLRRGPGGPPAQRPTVLGAGEGVLHVCSTPPVVPVAISCDPTAAVAAARAAVAPVLPAGAASVVPAPVADGWTVELPADVYMLTLEFPAGDFQPMTEKIIAYPPRYDSRVAVSP